MATPLDNINAALSRIRLPVTKAAPKPLTFRKPPPAATHVTVKPLTLRGAPAPAPTGGPVHIKLKPLGFAGVTQQQLTAPGTLNNPNAPPVVPAFTVGGATPDASGAISGSGVGGGDAAAAPSPDVAPAADTTSAGFAMTPAMWGLGALAALALVAVAVAGHHGYDVSDVS
jgi:hypothetical protein